VAGEARIADDAVIGPFCVVGPDVTLGAGVELISHVAVAGITEIGARTRIFPFASIGHAPQDKKYHGEPSRLVVGEDNVIREGVTMNPGTEGGGMLTRVGSRSLFMAGAHVAHDCQLGDDIIMANNATLAGHVTVGHFAFLGGISAVHQFCRIGDHAIVGGMTGVERDVIPYAMAVGDRARLTGLNLRGLRRRGFSREDIQALNAAYDLLFGASGTMAERLEKVAGDFEGVGPVMEVVAFIRADSSRALCQPTAVPGAA
jgi:UDP-N-acetylglucosamine acyltransferase